MAAKFTMSFTMDSAAFHDIDDDYGTEAARILRTVADQVHRGRPGGKILDVNGNTVGNWKVR